MHKPTDRDDVEKQNSHPQPEVVKSYPALQLLCLYTSSPTLYTSPSILTMLQEPCRRKENTENEASEQINPHLPVASIGTRGHPEIGALTDGECLADDRQPKDEVAATAFSNILNCRRGQ